MEISTLAMLPSISAAVPRTSKSARNVLFFLGEVMTTDGGASLLAMTTDSLTALEFPVLSVARAVITAGPSGQSVVSQRNVQDVVPEARLKGWPQADTSTLDMAAWLDEAIPATVMLAMAKVPGAGDMIATVGGRWLPMLTDSLAVLLPPHPSVTRATITVDPSGQSGESQRNVQDVVPEARLKGWPQADTSILTTVLLVATAVPAIVIVPKIEALGAGKVMAPCGSGLGNTAITAVPI